MSVAPLLPIRWISCADFYQTRTYDAKLEGPSLKGEFIALVEMLEKPSVYAAETKSFPVVSQLTHYRFSHE
jgi:hypothetical protein